MNNGINYIYKKNRFNKDEFEILGIQIAENKMHFNVIIRNAFEINHLYHLYSIEIPVQPIITINISLLLNALPIKLKQLKKQQSSYIISTDIENN
ncbi:hypothetical protein RhiirA4_471038 [Rhizophagus irregularis]|uniref:Uncharacterized protein n=1 Tax=Rhizophagus irregularis TaxID=588596 RepID=A0A2I1H2C1_9GLOM|nr:hypothetical protein RhiirA4_471038 [Rhizophagus irregularis]